MLNQTRMGSYIHVGVIECDTNIWRLREADHRIDLRIPDLCLEDNRLRHRGLSWGITLQWGEIPSSRVFELSRNTLLRGYGIQNQISVGLPCGNIAPRIKDVIIRSQIRRNSP